MRFPFRVIGSKQGPFAKGLQSYGFAACSFREDTLLVGLPPQDGWQPISEIPPNLRSVAFLAAPLQSDLIAQFVADPLAQQVDTLTIGTSHHYAEHKMGGYDMSAAIAALSKPLAALRKLHLGDMLQLFNGGQYYGKLGEIGGVFDHCPNLETLELYGQFHLAAPVQHDTLRSLYAAADSIGVSGGPVDQRSLNALLTSRFDVLQDLVLELDEDDLEEPYSLPDGFASEAAMPRLTKLLIDPLSPQAEEAMRDWHRTC